MNILTFIFVLIIPPFKIKSFLLNLLGHKVSTSSRIGINIIWKTKLITHKNSTLGSFNFIKIDNLTLGESATIGCFNLQSGRFSLEIKKFGAIGNFCTFKNAGLAVIDKPSNLVVGTRSKLTSHHYLDMSADVLIGNNTVIGGRDTQIWTHGFSHIEKGNLRYIKIEPVNIGSGVYIGSRCTINPATIIEDECNIGAASSVAGIISSQAYYCSQKLRVVGQLSKQKLEKENYIDYDYKCGNPRILDKKNN